MTLFLNRHLIKQAVGDWVLASGFGIWWAALLDWVVTRCYPISGTPYGTQIFTRGASIIQLDSSANRPSAMDGSAPGVPA